MLSSPRLVLDANFDPDAESFLYLVKGVADRAHFRGEKRARNARRRRRTNRLRGFGLGTLALVRASLAWERQ